VVLWAGRKWTLLSNSTPNGESVGEAVAWKTGSKVGLKVILVDSVRQRANKLQSPVLGWCPFLKLDKSKQLTDQAGSG